MKPNALQKIVLKEFPNSKVVDVADATTNPGRSLTSSVKHARSLQELKVHVTGHSKGFSHYEKVEINPVSSGLARKSSSRKNTAAAAKRPSGIVTVIPNNADGVARRQAKSVVVSRGKVIALQG